MKNIFKIFLTLFILAGVVNNADANSLNSLIKQSPIDKTSVIAVSVKNAETGKTVYEYNEKKLLHPASTLKVFTSIPAIDTLGEDYCFETGFYVYNNDLYVKLGADPFLTSLNIKDAVKSLKAQGYKTFKNVYFDDSIMDNVEWGVGWMWDDGTNALMQKFSAYNLDDNLMNISVSKNEKGSPVVTVPEKYSAPVINALDAGTKNEIYVLRHDWISPDIICLSGTVNGTANVSVPINNMKRYFEKTLFYYLNRSNVKVDNKTVLVRMVPANAKKTETVKNPAIAVMPSILKDSNNKNAETLAKIAGGVKAKEPATLSNQLKVFYDYWKEQGVDTSEIVVADGSGISRNNLLNTDFMTEALNKLYKSKGEAKMKEYLAQPGEGTMSDRMLNHRGSLFLKTGTLSNVSGITGYVIAQNGKVYSVAILIQNFNYPSKQVKIFENQLLEEIEKI